MLDQIYTKLIHWLMTESEPDQMPLSDFERIQYELRPCDILLIEGRSQISEVIKLITQSPWSHSALYIGRLHDIDNPELRERISRHYNTKPDQQLVIESLLGKGTIVSPIQNYMGDHIRICRPKGISRQDAQYVIGYSINQLGMSYDVRHILDLARFYFPYAILPRRWRSSLFRHQAGISTHQICSSMLAEAFGSVKFPILPIVKPDKHKGLQVYPRNPRLYTPSDFDYSPYFEIIKYPFYVLSRSMLYRNLPWNDDGVVGNNESELIHPNGDIVQAENKKKSDKAKKPKDDKPPPTSSVVDDPS